MDTPPPSRARAVGRTALAWAPFAFLWGVFNIVSFDAEPGPAFLAGINAIGWAAVLGTVVWWLTGRLPWPDRVRLGFYAVHLLFALVFAVSWLVLGAVGAALIAGDSFATVSESIRTYFVWRMLSGLWLYGLIAGVAYAMRIREALRRQEQAAIRAQALAMESQLEALRARLNPHFFFNALHSLSALIHHDPAAADDALDRIGQLLRRSLATDDSRVVPFAEEWDLTTDYLDLERMRLGDRLRVESSIDPGLERYPVPPFTLQPLVENAVIHGIAPRAEGGTLVITASLSDGRLRLEVADDGPGGPSEGGNGQGLDLLRRRLDAIYGTRASVATEAGRDGFRAVVELPESDR